MNKHSQKIKIRGKKLVILLRDSREAAQKTPGDCATALGISLEEYLAFEEGQSTPSLPQLEMLSFFLNISLEHFWDQKVLTTTLKPDPIQDRKRYIQIRDRVIGTQLKIARQGLNISISELAAQTDIHEDNIRLYESGDKSIPLPELEVLSDILGVKFDGLIDRNSAIGKWRVQQINVKKFMELPPDLQEFILKPVNHPYINLAIRLSELNADKLRAVAESLLEITY